jgi:hypothetical protein
MTHAEMIAQIKIENAKNEMVKQATEKQIAYFAKLQKLSAANEARYRAMGGCPYEIKLKLMIELERINKRGISFEIDRDVQIRKSAYATAIETLHA